MKLRPQDWLAFFVCEAVLIAIANLAYSDGLDDALSAAREVRDKAQAPVAPQRLQRRGNLTVMAPTGEMASQVLNRLTRQPARPCLVQIRAGDQRETLMSIFPGTGATVYARGRSEREIYEAISWGLSAWDRFGPQERIAVYRWDK